MMIVKFCSGIGNQLYQYAVFLMLKKMYPEVEVKADISAFEDDKLLNDGNGFSYGFALSSILGVQIDVASESEIKNLSYGMVFSRQFRKVFPMFVKRYSGLSRLSAMRGRICPKYKRRKELHIQNIPFNAYNGNIMHLDASKDYYFDGLWQNISYLNQVEDELKESISFSGNLSMTAKFWADKIKSIGEQSVAVHVRRGNFTIDKFAFSHDLCGLEYYMEAYNKIEKIVHQPTYFLFSDDIEWCRHNFTDNGKPIIYVSDSDGLSAVDEMFLMGQCANAIIPNSTFAFWSVWLGKQKKTVIYPRYVSRDWACWHEFSVPENWIMIENLL